MPAETPAATARVRSDFDRIAALPDDPCDHNVRHHERLLSALPARCGAALEIGCGTGAFTRRLAERAERVVGIDLAPAMIEAAQARCAGLANVRLEVADATAWELGVGQWDAIASIATLHHLPARDTLARVRDALRPGGVLLVLDLVAADGPADRLRSAAALALNAAWRLARTGRPRMTPHARRLWDEHGRHDVYPSLAEARALAAAALPGARVRRHLFWRYSLVWRKPGRAGATLAAPAAGEAVKLETTAAFHELLDVLRDGDRVFLEGPRAVRDEIDALEGYRWLTEVLGVALDCYLHADPAHPEFVRLVSPTRKFGGDNADAVYHFAPLDPARTYRVQGRMGDAVYLSLCVYGGPNDGRWSNRIVGSLHDRELAIGADRSFEVWLAPERPPGAASWLPLDPDAVCLVTRDYLVDPVAGRQADWSIEALPPAPAPAPLTDAELARRLRCTTSFLRDLLNICPLPPIGEPNAVAEPYRQQAAAYGWAAPDVVYAMGRYDLADDEALVLEGRAPACAFWNLCLWNPFLQTYDYRHHRVTINGGQIAPEPDGSWRVVISARDPGHPNWLTTAGHPRGVLWFRWFLADETPARPSARVVKV